MKRMLTRLLVAVVAVFALAATPASAYNWTQHDFDLKLPNWNSWKWVNPMYYAPGNDYIWTYSGSNYQLVMQWRNAPGKDTRFRTFDANTGSQVGGITYFPAGDGSQKWLLGPGVGPIQVLLDGQTYNATGMSGTNHLYIWN